MYILTTSLVRIPYRYWRLQQLFSYCCRSEEVVLLWHRRFRQQTKHVNVCWSTSTSVYKIHLAFRHFWREVYMLNCSISIIINIESVIHQLCRPQISCRYRDTQWAEWKGNEHLDDLFDIIVFCNSSTVSVISLRA